MATIPSVLFCFVPKSLAGWQNTAIVAQSGGWCLEESKPNSTYHAFDGELARTLGHLLKGQRVASFGDGPGLYKKFFFHQGLVTSYDAYDGAPFIENVTTGDVRYMDLTVPQYGLPVYDWVVCLEVAEHVPKEFEDILVSNIARHAQVGVVLSWAVPGQPGFSHVNCKSHEDVEEIMLRHGFELENDTSDLLRMAATLWWFKNNIQVYRRVTPDSISETDS